jgi:integrase
MQSGRASSESFDGYAIPATPASMPGINEKKSTVKNKTLGTLPPRAVDGFRRKLLTRRRHQDGQLIELQNGYAVRYYEDHEGQRLRVQKFLGSFEELPTRRSAQNRMQAELATVNQNPVAHSARPTATFRMFSRQWLEDCEQRKQKPIKPSVARDWRSILKNHLNPLIGEIPLSYVGNRTMKSVVEKLSKKELAPATIKNICLVVKLVVASAVDDDGNQLFPMKWNSRFIDAPQVDPTKQRKPSFTSAEVEKVIQTATGRIQALCLLLAASGLRIGEAIGLECRHFDGLALTIEQAVWGKGQVQAPKTRNAYRAVDLHPDVASLLKQFVGDRKKGYIFQTNGGQPVTQANVLKRELHPLLAILGIGKRGFHSFRRFRNTHLRQSRCPSGIQKFWMGHAGESMTDTYDRSAEDLQYRKDVAVSMGTGFEIPKMLTAKPSKKTLAGVNGRQSETVEPVLSY